MGSTNKFLYFVCVNILFFGTANVSCLKGYYWNEHYLEPGSVVSCCGSPLGSLDREQPQIYCYEGKRKHPVHLFETVLMEISISPEEYKLYEGSDAVEVMMEFDSHRSLWNMNFFTWKRKDVRLNPFNNTCIGIVTNQNYKVELSVIHVDYWRVVLCLAGILLFFLGPRLSKNVLFYYICGISFGVLASFLILIYFMSRILPRKPMMYGFVIGGWAISLYMLQMIWENVRFMSVTYKKYVVGYFVTTGILSFIICYRLGPVSDPRSKNIIKWALQSAGLGMVLLCSHFQEATLAIDLILILFYNFPSTWFGAFKRVYKTYIAKPRPRLLSEDEYYEQGVKETAKALEELRSFCSSPDCDQWKTVTKLKDPVSFDNLMEELGKEVETDQSLKFDSDFEKLD